MSTRIAIVDSGGANIASLKFALARLGVTTELTVDAARIRTADRVLLPGVGAARDSMARLREHGLVEVIRRLEQPVLGICLGMQLLAAASAEDDVECLGVFPAVAARLEARTDRPVPNMGWCVTRQSGSDPLLEGIADNSWFYYLHGYALPVGAYTLATAVHGGEFSAVIRRANFVAVQFHPERSSLDGARLLRNFVMPGS